MKSDNQRNQCLFCGAPATQPHQFPGGLSAAVCDSEPCQERYRAIPKIVRGSARPPHGHGRCLFCRKAATQPFHFPDDITAYLCDSPACLDKSREAARLLERASGMGMSPANMEMFLMSLASDVNDSLP